MPSPAQILASLEGAARAVRWTLVGDLGRIRSRRDAQEFFLDFRPYGRVWSNRGIRILDEATARRLLEQIRGQVADGTPLEEVIARYQPPRSKPNLVPTWLQRWAETLRREADAGSRSPLYAAEIARLAKPGNHLSFFDATSISEITYGRLENWSLWLADRNLGPTSRHIFLGYFRVFMGWLRRRGEIREIPEFARARVAEHEPRILGIRDQELVLERIPEADRGIFLALAHLGLRPSEARALTVGDYHSNGWITVDKAVKGKLVSSPVRGTKTGKPKRLPVSEEMRDWITRHVDPAGRLRQAPLFPNPRTGRIWPQKALYEGAQSPGPASLASRSTRARSTRSRPTRSVAV